MTPKQHLIDLINKAREFIYNKPQLKTTSS